MHNTDPDACGGQILQQGKTMLKQLLSQKLQIQKVKHQDSKITPGYKCSAVRFLPT